MLIDIVGMLMGNIMLILFMYGLSHKKEEYEVKKLILGIIIYNIFSYGSNEINEIVPRISLIILGLFFINSFLFEEKVSDSIFKVVITVFLLIIYELVFLGFFSLICNYSDIHEKVLMSLQITNDFFYSFLYNFLSIIFIALVKKSGVFNYVYKDLIIFYNKINKVKALILLVMVFSMIVLGYVVINTSEKVITTLLIFCILIIAIAYILIKNLNIRSEYEEVKEKYSNTKQSLLEYEDMIDKYRVNNHENKNQLLTIQSMINNKSCKVNKYIDELVGNVYMTNEKIMFDVSIIPAGGLRATIHTKLNAMDNKNIKYILNIDRKLRSVDFDNIDSELNLKICKIVSIFIDNSIEEVETHKDDKVVNIEMYLSENKLVIEVSNKFENKFDIEKIYHKKYTTKANGHGYGLALAKELIDSEKALKNIQMIEDNIFTQVLEIEIKK